MKKMLRFILLLVVLLGIAAAAGMWKVRQLADSKLLIFGGALAQDMMELMRYNFSLSREVLLNPDSMGLFLLQC